MTSHETTPMQNQWLRWRHVGNNCSKTAIFIVSKRATSCLQDGATASSTWSNLRLIKQLQLVNLSKSVLSNSLHDGSLHPRTFRVDTILNLPYTLLSSYKNNVWNTAGDLKKTFMYFSMLWINYVLKYFKAKNAFTNSQLRNQLPNACWHHRLKAKPATVLTE